MDRYLFFLEGTSDESDAICIPASQIVGFDIDNAATIEVYFNDLGSADTNDGLIVLNVTSGKTKEVANAIVQAMNHSTDPFIVIADDLNSEYIHSDLTGCGAIQEQA